jgi:hypothetical protein
MLTVRGFQGEGCMFLQSTGMHGVCVTQLQLVHVVDADSRWGIGGKTHVMAPTWHAWGLRVRVTLSN